MGMDSGIETDEPQFSFPSFDHEIGEIERVQQHFNIQLADFVAKFLERARAGTLERLSDEKWDALENTDSHSTDILRGDWNAVSEHAGATEPNRDWQILKEKIRTGEPIDAPVIVRRGGIFHLVSGNTRLMVCRALGVKPDVLIVDITDLK